MWGELTRLGGPDDVPPRVLQSLRIYGGASGIWYDQRITTATDPRGLKAAIFGRLFAMGSWKGSFRGELNTFVQLAEKEVSAGMREA